MIRRYDFVCCDEIKVCYKKIKIKVLKMIDVIFFFDVELEIIIICLICFGICFNLKECYF